MPAIDVLALENNEGRTYEKELNLLFAGKSYIRILFSNISTKFNIN